MAAKSMSKLADLMFGLELQNLLTMVDSPIASICAHPGYSITNIKNSTPLYIRCSPTTLSCTERRAGSTANTLRSQRANCSGRSFLWAGRLSGNKRIYCSSQGSCSGARPYGRTTALEGIRTSHRCQLFYSLGGGFAVTGTY
jgi:hypothetical protein